MTYLSASPAHFSRIHVETFAEEVGKRMGFGPNGDIHDLVSRLNGAIHYEEIWDLSNTKDGSIQVEPDGTFRIYLPLHTGIARDRFTVAHELGHYFLHWRCQPDRFSAGQGMKAERAGTGQKEWEANWFAAGILMPSQEFIDAFNRRNHYIPFLATDFGVSISAAEVRAKALGLK
jgi:predicted transcriptional regulator